MATHDSSRQHRAPFSEGRGTSLKFSRRVARRYLWSKRSEAFISIITSVSIFGVAIGVMVLTMVMAIMTGFEHELRDKIIGTNSHIVIRRISGQISGWRQVIAEVQAVAGVQSVSPFTYHQALIRVGDTSTGLLLRGIEPKSPGAAQLEGYLEVGQSIDALFTPPSTAVFSQDQDGEAIVQLPGVAIGRELSRSLGVHIGTPVSLLAPSVSSTPFGLIPKFKRFVVTNSYRSGLLDYESGLAYIALPEAQRFFKMGDSVSGLEVRVGEIDAAPRIAAEIMAKVGSQIPGLYAQDWTETNKPLWDAIKLEKKAYFIVLLLIIVMASFSIVTTLVMMVLEKRRDVAIMKTLGATTGSIANIFRIQGAIIGAFGTVLGLVLGWAGSVALAEYGFPLDEKIFQMSALPVELDWRNFVAVGVSAFMICLLATIYPARRASRLEPIEALRHE